MTYYKYTAIDQYGHQQRGYMEMPTEQALMHYLQQQGLELLLIRHAQASRWLTPRIGTHLLVVLCVQLEQLLQAGIPLLQSISALAEQCEHQGMRSALWALHRDLEAGQLLSQALQSQPKIFPSLFGQLVEAGERTGQLPQMFGHLAHTLQWQSALTTQVRQGLTYPGLLCLMVIIAAYVMLTFLVPQLSGFLLSLGQTLPWSTQLLLHLSAAVTTYGGWWLLGWLVLLSGLGLAVRRSDTHRVLLDRLLLKLPVIGKLLQQLLLARVCRYLGLMYQAGIPLLQALQWCQPLLGNRAIERALADIQQQVEAGETLASSFAATGQFPSLMVRMLGVGETTGGLDRMLFQLAAFYDRELQTRLQALLRLLEPVLTILLGGMLLFLMAAVLLPIYDSFSSLRY